MALTEATRNVKTKVLTFIQVATGEGILKAGLSAPDLATLDEVNTNGTGADLKTKMGAYTLSNGKTALEVYGQNVYNMDAYAAVALKKFLSGSRQSTTVAEHEGEITDHEARIATLEAAP